jgi:hypothetical protein
MKSAVTLIRHMAGVLWFSEGIVNSMLQLPDPEGGEEEAACAEQTFE